MPYLLNNEDPKRLHCQYLEVAARKEAQKACKTTVGKNKTKTKPVLAGWMPVVCTSAEADRRDWKLSSIPAGATQETLRPCSQLLWEADSDPAQPS